MSKAAPPPAADPADPGVPVHVAIIMDGNGRWATQHGLPRIKGHEKGAESVRVAIRTCRKLGIRYLTLYAFSVENWSRPKAEVDALMSLLRKFLRDEEHELHENKVRLRVIGRLTDLPASVRDELARVMQATAAYTGGTLVLALSYGGRTEIAAAAREIARQARLGTLDPETVDERTVAAHLYAPDIPDPDLMIRTSGEMRISNFLLWQVSYAELYITDVLWPDFREEHLAKAVEAYKSRQRRFGRVG
jgi:undecaprenyl diphosphate synthase